MSDKRKRFPLSLAALHDKSLHGTVTTPKQTAARNVRNAYMSASVNAKQNMSMVSDTVRQAMVTRLAQDGITDTQVLAAMQAIPRHFF